MVTKVVNEVAVNEFERWASSFEIDTDIKDLDEDDTKAFHSFKNKFIKRVENGIITVDDAGVITMLPKGVENPMVFDEPTGELLSARLKNDSDVQAARRVLGSWAGVSPKVFSDMKLRDFNFCSELLAFFTNS